MRVEVNETTDFSQHWVDASAPNLNWQFDQRSFEECEEENGIYYATYEPMVVLKEMTITYLNVEEETTYTLGIGTYGIRP